MLDDNKFDAAGSIIEELSEQEIDTDAAQVAGGIWTIPTTSTIGYICTVSWECTSPHVSCGG